MRSHFFGVTMFPAASGLYLLFAGQVSPTELIATFPVAAAATAAAVLLRRRSERRLRLPPLNLRAVLRVLAALPLDSARVGAVLLRAIRRRPANGVGTISPQPFHPGGAQPEAAGCCALVTLGASLAPNGYVLEALPSLVLHRLAASAPSDDTQWPT